MNDSTRRTRPVRRRPTLSRADKANILAAFTAAIVLGTLGGLVRAAELTPTVGPVAATPAASVVTEHEVTTIILAPAPVAVPAPASTHRIPLRTSRTTFATATAPVVVRCAYDETDADPATPTTVTPTVPTTSGPTVATTISADPTTTKEGC